MTKWSKRVLFTLTGYLFYAIISIPMSLVMYRICPPTSPMSSDCAMFYSILILFAIFCLPYAIRSFHRTGRWLWSLYFPEFARA